jgi:hypothetical protein
MINLTWAGPGALPLGLASNEVLGSVCREWCTTLLSLTSLLLLGMNSVHDFSKKFGVT